MSATQEQIHAAAVDLLCELYRPESEMAAWRWCEENLVLAPSETKRLAGRFDTSHAPYLRTVIDFMQRREPWDIYDELWIMKSSGTGVTLGVLAGLAWRAANRPGNFMYAINNREDAKKVAKRLKVLLENCAAFKSRPVFDEREEQSSLLFKMKNGDGHFIGGGSPGQFAGKPNMDVGIYDEADLQYIAGEESPGPELLRDRFKNSAEKCLVGLCKPVVFAGVINQEFLTGTRHRLYVPCPYCNFMQTLEFGDPEQRGKLSGLYFDDLRDKTGSLDLELVLRHTRYRCAGCQKLIEEKWKRQMVLAYDLRQTNHGQEEKFRPHPRKMSMHVSDLYSQFPLASWGNIATEYIMAASDGDKRQAFRNSRLGLPREEEKSETAEDDILLLAGPGFGQAPYAQNVMPVMPALMKTDPTQAAVFKFTDVQMDVKISTIVAFDADENLYVLDTNHALNYDELLSCETVTAIDAKGVDKRFAVQCGMIDSGYRPDDVRDFCQRARGFYQPSLGRGGSQVKGIAALTTTPHAGRIMTTYYYNDDIFKSRLYIDRIGHSVRQRRSELAAKPDEAPYKSPYPFIRFFQDPDPEFCAGFCKERRIAKRVNGKIVWGWADDVKGNDPGDTVKMALVRWYFARDLFALNPRKDTPTISTEAAPGQSADANNNPPAAR